MNEIAEFLRISAILAGGLLIRFLLLLVVIAVYSIPIFAAWGLYRLYMWAQGRPIGLEKVDGLLLAGERYYTPAHSWIAPSLFRGLRVGLDDVAQRILPGVTAVSLPPVGAELRKGERVAVVTCGDRVASIAAPIDGTVTAVNLSVGRKPGLLNRSPYGKGWLFALTPKDDAWRALPTGGRAREWIRTEGHRLAGFIDHELGMAAADGGELIIPGPAALSRERWDALVEEFLRS